MQTTKREKTVEKILKVEQLRDGAKSAGEFRACIAALERLYREIGEAPRDRWETPHSNAHRRKEQKRTIRFWDDYGKPFSTRDSITKRCTLCGDLFQCSDNKRLYCCEECQEAAKRRDQRNYKRRKRAEAKARGGKT